MRGLTTKDLQELLGRDPVGQVIGFLHRWCELRERPTRSTRQVEGRNLQRTRALELLVELRSAEQPIAPERVREARAALGGGLDPDFERRFAELERWAGLGPLRERARADDRLWQPLLDALDRLPGASPDERRVVRASVVPARLEPSDLARFEAALGRLRRRYPELVATEREWLRELADFRDERPLPRLDRVASSAVFAAILIWVPVWNLMLAAWLVAVSLAAGYVHLRAMLAERGRL